MRSFDDIRAATDHQIHIWMEEVIRGHRSSVADWPLQAAAWQFLEWAIQTYQPSHVILAPECELFRAELWTSAGIARGYGSTPDIALARAVLILELLRRNPLPARPEPESPPEDAARRGTCRLCGCTDDEACRSPNGYGGAHVCTWVDKGHRICSECMIRILRAGRWPNVLDDGLMFYCLMEADRRNGWDAERMDRFSELRLSTEQEGQQHG